MTTTRRLHLNLVQQKSLATASKLVFKSSDVEGRHVTSLQLVGYNITGFSGSTPTHLLLVYKNLRGGGAEYISVTDDKAPSFYEQNLAHTMLYPPGGATTQNKRYTSIGDGQAVLMKLQNLECELQKWDSSRKQYVRFDDYTECVLEFIAESYEDVKAVRRVKA